MTCVITSENTVVLGGCEQLIAGTTVQCTWDGGENQCTTCPAGSACQSSNTIDPPPYDHAETTR